MTSDQRRRSVMPARKVRDRARARDGARQLKRSRDDTTSPMRGHNKPKFGHVSERDRVGRRRRTRSDRGRRSRSFSSRESSRSRSTSSEGDAGKRYADMRGILPAREAAVPFLSALSPDHSSHVVIVDGFVVPEHWQRIAYGEYILEDNILGKGVSATVHGATPLHPVASHPRVALKIFRGFGRYDDACEDEYKLCNIVASKAPTPFLLQPLDIIRHKAHSALVLPRCGPSLLQVLERNTARPLPFGVVQSVLLQVLMCLRSLHSCGIVHTDIKPENILFESVDSYVSVLGGAVVPVTTSIRVIDLGNAEETRLFRTRCRRTDRFISNTVIQTRHYRAPEVVLRTGWDASADMWSVGCMIPELLSGECLFMTHSDAEHLALMERILGPIPVSVFRSSSELHHFFHRSSHDDTTLELREHRDVSDRFVRDHMNLRATMKKVCGDKGEALDLFCDLTARLLHYDPCKRITAAEACNHPLFKGRPS